MPVNPHLTTRILAGRAYFRLTPQTYLTRSVAKNKQVVNGQGAKNSPTGSRYAHAAMRSVYLTENVGTCLAEAMFYFHREVLTALDAPHILGVAPPFQKTSVLWEITFTQDVVDVADLSVANAAAFAIYPALMLNPSQDFEHLRRGRGRLEAQGYNGLIAPSSRVIGGGNMVVAFSDLSKNVATIQPRPVDLRLVCDGAPTRPFANQAVDLLSYNSGEVRFHGAGVPGFSANVWKLVNFNH